MCDNRPAIVHCMRWRPTVKFGGQNDMSNEAAFQLLTGLWEDLRGVMQDLGRIVEPADREELKATVQWLVILVLAHMVFEYLHHDGNGAHKACMICYQLPSTRTCLMLPCYHQMCEQCAVKYRKGKGGRLLECPLCKVDRTIMLY